MWRSADEICVRCQVPTLTGPPPNHCNRPEADPRCPVLPQPLILMIRKVCDYYPFFRIPQKDDISQPPNRLQTACEGSGHPPDGSNTYRYPQKADQSILIEIILLAVRLGRYSNALGSASPMRKT
jgi:hypothetical protein